jgi:uncharacterized membrane protein YtjA (UPF0391 family)
MGCLETDGLKRAGITEWSTQVTQQWPSALLLHSTMWRCEVLYWAFMFLIVGLVAAMLGFTNIAGGAFAIAKFLAGLFLVLFLIFLILGLAAARKIVS